MGHLTTQVLKRSAGDPLADELVELPHRFHDALCTERLGKDRDVGDALDNFRTNRLDCCVFALTVENGGELLIQVCEFASVQRSSHRLRARPTRPWDRIASLPTLRLRP
jgi:hypothetical protein